MPQHKLIVIIITALAYMSYPPATRCSNVSFCAIFPFFKIFFLNSHHNPVGFLKERWNNKVDFVPPACCCRGYC